MTGLEEGRGESKTKPARPSGSSAGKQDKKKAKLKSENLKDNRGVR
jgi:hypothetical protein